MTSPNAPAIVASRDYWQRLLSAIFGDTSLDVAESRVTLGIRRLTVGPLTFILGDGPPHRVRTTIRDLPPELDVFSLLFVEEGRFHLQNSGRSLVIEAGQMTILNQSQALTIDHDTSYRLLTVLVPKRLVINTFSGDFATLIAPLDSSHGLPAFILRTALTLCEMVQETSLAEDDARALSDTLVFAIGRLMSQLNPTGANAVSDWRITRMVSFIEDRHADKHLSREEIAAHVGAPIRTLNRLLATRGLSVSQLIVDRRLEQARILLQRRDLRHWSIARMADEVGYADPAHFSKIFSQRFGLSPNKYRRQADE